VGVTLSVVERASPQPKSRAHFARELKLLNWISEAVPAGGDSGSSATGFSNALHSELFRRVVVIRGAV
jgi:hypothetical protein